MASLLGGGTSRQNGRPGASTTGGRVQVPGNGYYASIPQILFHGPLMKMKSKRGMGSGRGGTSVFHGGAVNNQESTPCATFTTSRMRFGSTFEPRAWRMVLPLEYLSGRQITQLERRQQSKYPHGFVINTRKRDLYRAKTKEHYCMGGQLCSACGIAPPMDVKWPGGDLVPYHRF